VVVIGWRRRRKQVKSQIEMPEEDLVDIKFRLYDGSDIGPFRYSSTSTVDMLKQRIVSDWPRGFFVFTFSLFLSKKKLLVLIFIYLIFFS
jgi:hypothetical protein